MRYTSATKSIAADKLSVLLQGRSVQASANTAIRKQPSFNTQTACPSTVSKAFKFPLSFSYASLTSDRDQERVRATLKVVWSSRFTSLAT